MNLTAWSWMKRIVSSNEDNSDENEILLGTDGGRGGRRTGRGGEAMTEDKYAEENRR